MNCIDYHPTAKQVFFKTGETRRTGIFRTLFSKRVISLAVLLGLFLAFYTSFSTMHLHIAEDGRLYVHYHPIKKTDHDNTKSGHSHKQNDLGFISHFNKLFEKGLSIQQIHLTNYKSTEIISAYTSRHSLKPVHTRIHTDRAPPAV